MATEHSFDLTAEIDLMEVKNALEVAKKEVIARYDFKDIVAEISLDEKAKAITLISSSNSKVDALKDIVISKLIKRNIPAVGIEETKRESVGGNKTKANLKINDVINSEDAKKITKSIKNSKMKVNAQIRGDEIRVTSKSIDDLQECMKLIKSLDMRLPLNFRNLK